MTKAQHEKALRLLAYAENCSVEDLPPDLEVIPVQSHTPDGRARYCLVERTHGEIRHDGDHLMRIGPYGETIARVHALPGWTAQCYPSDGRDPILIHANSSHRFVSDDVEIIGRVRGEFVEL